MRIIDPYSLTSLPVEMAFGETLLSTATAFVWKASEQYFLITNWHVVTGRHPETGRHLSVHAGEPDRIRTYFTAHGEIGSKRGMVMRVLDQQGQPRWWVHPVHGRKVDVIALPFQVPLAEVELHPINDFPEGAVTYPVGSDVFVIGFPLGVSNGFPVWKRASIASEPELRAGADPLLIDTATRPGMSGSPVIRRATSYVSQGATMFGPEATRFIGVYSGRLAAKDALDAQLGMVWPVELLKDIVEGRRLDKPSLII